MSAGFFEVDPGAFMMTGRTLPRSEIPAVWSIDRSELIEAVYHMEAGALVLKPARFDARGWPPGQAEHYTPILEECFDHGGWFYGLFDEQRLAGVAVLENRFIGQGHDQLQLKFLHVSRAHRDRGLGRRLFGLAAAEARCRGAHSLYVSATPSEHTIRFYLGLGCRLVREPDPDLFALEPEDIHLEYALGPETQP